MGAIRHYLLGSMPMVILGRVLVVVPLGERKLSRFSLQNQA